MITMSNERAALIPFLQATSCPSLTKTEAHIHRLLTFSVRAISLGIILPRQDVAAERNC